MAKGHELVLRRFPEELVADCTTNDNKDDRYKEEGCINLSRLREYFPDWPCHQEIAYPSVLPKGMPSFVVNEMATAMTNSGIRSLCVDKKAFGIAEAGDDFIVDPEKRYAMHEGLFKLAEQILTADDNRIRTELIEKHTEGNRYAWGILKLTSPEYTRLLNTNVGNWGRLTDSLWNGMAKENLTRGLKSGLVASSGADGLQAIKMLYACPDMTKLTVIDIDKVKMAGLRDTLKYTFGAKLKAYKDSQPDRVLGYRGKMTISDREIEIDIKVGDVYQYLEDTSDKFDVVSSRLFLAYQGKQERDLAKKAGENPEEQRALVEAKKQKYFDLCKGVMNDEAYLMCEEMASLEAQVVADPELEEATKQQLVPYVQASNQGLQAAAKNLFATAWSNTQGIYADLNEKACKTDLKEVLSDSVHIINARPNTSAGMAFMDMMPMAALSSIKDAFEQSPESFENFEFITALSKRVSGLKSIYDNISQGKFIPQYPSALGIVWQKQTA